MMDDLEILMQKYPFLFNLIKYHRTYIKILELLDKKANSIEEICDKLKLKRYVVEEGIDYLLKHNMIDKLYLNNKVVYFLTSFGKKFLEAYRKEY